MGSAGNALIDRLPRNESWFTGRSHCDKCKHELGVWDLIPVFSFLFLHGKCRYCRTTIPYRNLIVELIAGMGAIYFTNIILFMIFWVTVVITVMDWETKTVSEILIVFWGLLALMQGFDLRGLIVGVLIIGGIWVISKGKAMGFGDVEIALVMGLALGFPKIVTALWLAFVLGAIMGLLLIIRRKVKAKSVIAFGPFLIMGYWIAFFWGDRLIKYLFGGYV